MNILIRYLKKSSKSIFLIILLLILQAYCDLSLPNYTSKIVNIGIQQSGIDEVYPKVIRDSEMNKLIIFMKYYDEQFVLEKYDVLDKNNLSDEEYAKYSELYEELKNQPLYKIKDDLNEEDLEKLNDIFLEPIVIVSNIDNNSATAEAMKDNLKNLIPQTNTAEDLTIYQILNLLPEDKKQILIDKINEGFTQMPESLASQASISYIKDEYENLGIDTYRLQTEYIYNIGGKMLTVALTSGICTISVAYIASKVAAKLSKNMRKDLYTKVISFSNSEFDKFSTASLITRTTNDTIQIQTFIVMLLRMILYAPILGGGGVIRVLKTDKSMAWIIAVALITISIVIGVLFGSTISKFKLVQKLVDKVNGVAREILSGISVIRAFNTEEFEEERFNKANTNLTKTNLFVNRVMAFMMPSMMLIMNAITVLIVFVGAKQIDLGNMQVGNLMAFIQYTMQIVMSFLMISMVSIMLPRALVSANRIFEVLNTELTIQDIDKTEEFDETKKGTVEYRNVSFKYDNSEEYILKDISFTAEKGKVTAIIGSTGSGKSTLINLIPRFFDVTEGELLVDGVNVKKVSQHKLREKIGFVPQKGLLFSGTIESNIKYGKDDATAEEVKEAARISQSEHFIESKKEKYASSISQGGTNVSGGQKQRLSIARAIISKPEILIFDDSFSALDYKTDVTLRKALREERSESTRIVVAQRISTILDANEIIVLDKGTIVGKGTHKHLMENCEVYKQIALSQLSKDELDV